MSLLGGSASDGGAAALQAQRQAAIDQGVAQTDQTFSQFTPAFYNKAATDYEGYATPQPMNEYQTTKNNLAYALSRNGILNSSAAVNSGASLNKELSQNENTIANTAQDQSNTLQSDVATQKSNIINELESSADPTEAASSSAAAVAGLQAPPAYQPLGSLFSDWSNTYLANMNAQAFNPQQASIWSLLGGWGGGGGQQQQTGSSLMVP